MTEPVYDRQLSMFNPFNPEFKNNSRNSRLVVDEDDMKWVTSEKNVLLFLKQFY